MSVFVAFAVLFSACWHQVVAQQAGCASWKGLSSLPSLKAEPFIWARQDELLIFSGVEIYYSSNRGTTFSSSSIGVAATGMHVDEALNVFYYVRSDNSSVFVSDLGSAGPGEWLLDVPTNFGPVTDISGSGTKVYLGTGVLNRSGSPTSGGLLLIPSPGSQLQSVNTIAGSYVASVNAQPYDGVAIKPVFASVVQTRASSKIWGSFDGGLTFGAAAYKGAAGTVFSIDGGAFLINSGAAPIVYSTNVFYETVLLTAGSGLSAGAPETFSRIHGANNFAFTAAAQDVSTTASPLYASYNNGANWTSIPDPTTLSSGGATVQAERLFYDGTDQVLYAAYKSVPNNGTATWSLHSAQCFDPALVTSTSTSPAPTVSSAAEMSMSLAVFTISVLLVSYVM